MPIGPVTIEAPLTRRGLLFELLAAMRFRTRVWRALLRTMPELLGFVALNVVCTAVMIFKNFQNLHASLAFYPLFLMIALPLIYGGVFLFMYFPAAFCTDEGRATPRSRWPRWELALTLLYTVAFLNAGTWMRQHGHGDWLIARWHLAFANVVKTVHVSLFHFYRPGVINAYVFLAIPLIVLLPLSRPRDLGFRMPAAPPGLLIGFVALFAYALAAQTHGPLEMRLFAGAAALFGAGLPEEFLYRAVIQTRLEAVLKSPVRAIIITSLLFGGVHLVAHERDGILWQLTNAFGMKALLGFVFGHLYYRTRSLWPGTLLHATLDVAFFARIL